MQCVSFWSHLTPLRSLMLQIDRSRFFLQVAQSPRPRERKPFRLRRSTLGQQEINKVLDFFLERFGKRLELLFQGLRHKPSLAPQRKCHGFLKAVFPTRPVVPRATFGVAVLVAFVTQNLRHVAVDFGQPL